jgi:predicted N-formylglutamate amidohydrolase
MTLIITCEHAGNYIPEEYCDLFKGALPTLNTHKGIDFGALELAKSLAAGLRAPLHYTMISRLLIEANRSESAEDLFSEYSRDLSPSKQKEIKDKYYLSYRNKIENQISGILKDGGYVVHLSIHSFTPVFKGEVRNVDIGLLFDPERQAETVFCEKLMETLKRETGYTVKYNEPYKGTDDGFTVYLRQKFDDPLYAGIEIEVNQKFPLDKFKKNWNALQKSLKAAIQVCISSMEIENTETASQKRGNFHQH